MTPEEILELLPKKKAHTYSSENADVYTSYDYGYVDARNECANALAGKVVAKEDLLTENDYWNICIKANGCKSNKEDCSFGRCRVWSKCERIIEESLKAQQRKANREKV
jgi:hypothetical protein